MTLSKLVRLKSRFSPPSTLRGSTPTLTAINEKAKRRTGRRRANRKSIYQSMSKREQPASNCKMLATALVLLLCLTSAASPRPSAPFAAAQTSTDQASNAISTLLKQNQASACDGELLEIKCNDDYVIEIITAELTILHGEYRIVAHASNRWHQQDDNKVTFTAGAGNSSAGTRADPSPSNQTAPSAGPTSLATVQTGDHQRSEPAICPALVHEGGPSQSAGDRPTGNGTESAARGACSETEALELAAERKGKFLSLVRKQCSLLNACSIDLRLGPHSSGNSTQTGSRPASGPAANFMAQFLAESCPENRKLFEMAYKCRPTKFRSKSACRNGRVSLECVEPGKRLTIGSAVYGFWPEDKKTHDRCQLEEERQNQVITSAAGRPLAAPLNATRSNCSNNPNLAFGMVTRECLFKQYCQFQVQPSLLASCPQSGQLDYLKMVYVCVSEEHLVTTNASYLQRQLALSMRDQAAAGRQELSSGDQASSSFTSPNVSSSLLLASSSPQQQFITPPANVGAGLLPPGEPPTATMTILNPGPNRLSTLHAQRDPQTGPTEEQTSRIYEVLAADPQLGSVHPSNWTASQRVKFVLLRYQKHLIAFAVITISVSTLLALLVRLACGRRSSRHSNASSTSSSKSSSGSANVQKSFGSSSSTSSSTNCTNQTACTATVASNQLLNMNGLGGFAGHSHQHHLLAAHQNNYSKMPDHMPAVSAHQHQKQRPTNSCSESCFSLDDCACPQHRAGKQRTFQHQMDTPLNNNSPALQSTQTATPPIEVSSMNDNCQQEQRQVNWASSTLTMGGARPKLWSFYVNEQHSNSLRLANYAPGQPNQPQQQQQQLGGASTTSRPQRTFAGPPQPARNFECLQRRPGDNMTQLEPHQSEYLLAMASVGQQFQQFGSGSQQANLTPSGDGCWQPDGLPVNQRLHLLTLNPGELLSDPHQQQALSNNQTGPTCAFHSQQQQQHHHHQVPFMMNDATGRNSEQPIGAGPTNFEFGHQLEMPPPPATTIQSAHQF